MPSGGHGGASVPGPGASSPGRSANGAAWSTHSDPTAKTQSQGHRSILCGAVGALNQFMAWSNQLSPEQAQTLIGIGIIAGAIIVTGGAAIPFILTGAVLGGSIAYGVQGMHNRQQGMNFWEAVDPRNIGWSQVGAGAFQGAVSGAVAGVVSHYLPVSQSLGLGGKLVATASVEFISGRAEQVAVNVVSQGWSHWDDDLFALDKLSWWGQVALDVLPGVGATLLKPAWKGIRGGISGAADRWRLTKGLPPELEEISQRVKVMIPDEKPRQITGNLDKLYEQAAVADIELRKLTQEIADLTGGKPGYREGLKGRERALQKIQGEYGGDASSLLDIAGSKITFDSIDDLYRALEKISKQYEIAYIKDRFVKPQPSGYRDILMNIRMKNGHIAELRLHLEVIEKAAELEHLQSYQPRRTIKATAVIEKRSYTPEEKAQIEELLTLSQKLFEDAWQKALNNRP